MRIINFAEKVQKSAMKTRKPDLLLKNEIILGSDTQIFHSFVTIRWANYLENTLFFFNLFNYWVTRRPNTNSVKSWFILVCLCRQVSKSLWFYRYHVRSQIISTSVRTSMFDFASLPLEVIRPI